MADESRERFSVPPAGTDYYVNDASLAGDEYTTAAGDNRNTGKTPGDPKANLLPVLRGYSLGPGQTVQIDTGDYIHVRNVLISVIPRWAMTRAPPSPARARLTWPRSIGPTPTPVRPTSNSTTADYVTLRHLTLTGARMGLWVHNSSTNFAGTDLVVSGNSEDGIRIESDATGTSVHRLTAFDNGGYGVYIAAPITRLSDSEAYNNEVGIYVSNSASGSPAIVGSTDLAAGGGNLVHDNTSTGISASGNVVVAGNAVWGQSGSYGTGINAQGSSAVVSQNVVYGNRTGIRGSYSTIEENRVYHNTGTGISLDDDGTVRANVVFSNATGISGQTSYYDFTGQVRNNLVYANTNTWNADHRRLRGRGGQQHGLPGTGRRGASGRRLFRRGHAAQQHPLGSIGLRHFRRVLRSAWLCQRLQFAARHGCGTSRLVARGSSAHADRLAEHGLHGWQQPSPGSIIRRSIGADGYLGYFDAASRRSR